MTTPKVPAPTTRASTNGPAIPSPGGLTPHPLVSLNLKALPGQTGMTGSNANTGNAATGFGIKHTGGGKK